MSQHPSQVQLTAYSERTLLPDELLAVDSHLAACDECHKRLIGLAPSTVRPVWESAEEPFHLDYEQHLEPYVDGKANDIEREIVDSHVALCSECAAELSDLLEFKQQPVATTTSDARKSSRRKQWFPQWLWLLNPAWAKAAAVASFVLITAVALWSIYPTHRPVEQATFTPTPQEQGREKDQSPPWSYDSIPRENSNQSPQNEAKTAPPPEQTLVMVYDGDGQIVLTQHGRLEGVGDLPPDLRESVEQALATRQLPASANLTGWSTGASNMRGDLNFSLQREFAPLAPTDVVVETDRPTFRWGALDAAQNYTVTVYDGNGQVATSGPVTGTEWTTPNALARGITYSWQISALKDGEKVVTPQPPLPEARFKILDQPAVVTLAKLRETVGNSHLVMGVFYWKHGLVAESEREFQALAKANPKSAVVKALLANIRSFRPG
jgi:hypothetical protein